MDISLEDLIYGYVDLTTEEDAFADSDWEEANCPICGRDQGGHTTAMMTRCAVAQFNSRSY